MLAVILLLHIMCVLYVTIKGQVKEKPDGKKGLHVCAMGFFLKAKARYGFIVKNYSTE